MSREKVSKITDVAPRAVSGPQPDSSLDTPLLRRAEIEQSRRTGMAGVVFNMIGLLVSPLFGGDPLALQVFIGGLALGVLCNLYLWAVASNEKRHTTRAVMAYFCVAPLLNSAMLYYLGVFGPLVVIFVLNIFSTCLAYSKRIAQVTLYASMVPVVGLGVPTAFGWLADVGLISFAFAVGAIGKTVLVATFMLFLVLVYLQARATRELVVSSLVDREAAVRKSARHEALFFEARQDLERALRVGGIGRFSDQTLGGFKLGAVIGRGDMGEVYEASHAETGEHAAVKMLLPEVLTQPAYLRRFRREARIAAKLESSHIARVLSVGGESAPRPYLAMERLQGEDLAQRLRREGQLEPGGVAVLTRQTGRAVAAAAEAGIVHRDLKPQNLFVTDDDEPVWKVLDFGVSKLSAGVTISQGETVGTPQYMAPEQVRGGEVDLRTDLYALGAIAYRALTGVPPFSARDASDVMRAVLHDMPLRPSAIAKLPSQIDLVLSIAMAKSPEDRFADGDELADAIEAASASRLGADLVRRANAILDLRPWSEMR